MRTILVALLCLASAGCASASDTAARRAAEAAALLDAGDVASARRAAMASVKARDDIAANWVLLGRIELRAGNIANAYAAYAHAIELDAANVEALQITADIALQIGRTRDATAAADQLLALQPNLSRPMVVKGLVAIQENRFDDAEKLADTILANDPNDDGGVTLKARTLVRKGDTSAAATLLENRLRSGASEFVLATLVEVQRKAGDAPALADALRRLIAIRPTDDRAFDLADVQYKRGLPNDARAVILDRLANRPDDEALFRRATDFWIDFDRNAFDAPRVARIAASGSVPLREAAARVLIVAGHYQDADKVLGADAGDAASTDVRALHATVLDALGQGTAAAQRIDAVLAIDKTNADALLLRARQRLRVGGTGLTGALEDAQLVLRDDPNSVNARLLAIEIYHKRKDDRRSRQLFEEAIAQMPKNLRIATSFATFLNATGDRKRAIDIARNYTELNTATVGGWELLGRLCSDAVCSRQAAEGKQMAMRTFGIDLPPGVRAGPDRFGRI